MRITLLLVSRSPVHAGLVHFLQQLVLSQRLGTLPVSNPAATGAPASTRSRYEPVHPQSASPRVESNHRVPATRAGPCMKGK
jgi:hypothetical protein